MLIVGADIVWVGTERLLFEIVRTAQNMVPDSDGDVVAKPREVGLMFSLQPIIPKYVSRIVLKLVEEALKPLRILRTGMECSG